MECKVPISITILFDIFMGNFSECAFCKTLLELFAIYSTPWFSFPSFFLSCMCSLLNKMVTIKHCQLSETAYWRFAQKIYPKRQKTESFCLYGQKDKIFMLTTHIRCERNFVTGSLWYSIVLEFSQNLSPNIRDVSKSEINPHKILYH